MSEKYDLVSQIKKKKSRLLLRFVKPWRGNTQSQSK